MRPVFAVSVHPGRLRPSASGPAPESGSCCPLGAAKEPPDSVHTNTKISSIALFTFLSRILYTYYEVSKVQNSILLASTK